MKTAFADTAVTVTSTVRSLINDTTTGIPTQTADGVLLGAVVRCSAAAAGDQFYVRVLGTSSEVLWEETRTGPWATPIVIPAMVLTGTGWDIVGYKLAGTDRSMGIEGVYDTLTGAGLDNTDGELVADWVEGRLPNPFIHQPSPFLVKKDTASFSLHIYIPADINIPSTADPLLDYEVLVMKDGGGFGAASDAVVQYTGEPGWYEILFGDTITSTDANTLGALTVLVRDTAPDAEDPRTFLDSGITGQVVAFDPESATNLGLSDITSILADTYNIQTRLPAALVSGRMESHVAVIGSNVITAGAIATDAIDSDAIAASAVTKIQSGLATAAAVAALPTAASNADAVWDEARAGHVAAGSFGEGVIVNSIANAAITAASIATDAISAAKVAADAVTKIADGFLAKTIDGTVTVVGYMRRMASLATGLGTGFNGTSPVFKRADGTTTAWSATQDTAAGDRTAVTLGSGLDTP